MIACFHLVALLVNEYLPPEWLKDSRDITREIVAAMVEADANAPCQKGTTRANCNHSKSIFPEN